MTLDTALSKALYQGNGSATQFPFAFKVWKPDQIRVTVTGPGRESRDVTSQSRIELTEDGGVVTYPLAGEALSDKYFLSVTRNMPFVQDIDLVSGSKFDVKVMETGMDQSAAERQQLREELDRAVILPPTSEQSPEEVVEDIYAARDEAQASAEAAAQSATAAEKSAVDAAASESHAKEYQDWSCQCADRAEQARDVALAQAVATNELMVAETSKINAIVVANKDDQQAAIARAKAWADSDMPPDPDEPESKSAKTWAKVAEENVIENLPTTSKTQKGVMQVGNNLDVTAQGVVDVPLASESMQGIGRSATTAEVESGITGENGPAWVTPERLKERLDAENNRHTPGDIAFKAQRYNELPSCWYFMNGTRYAVGTPQEKVLRNLSVKFKEDWGITTTDEGTNVPNWYHSDGRGPTMRAVNVAARQVGSIEEDAIQKITGSMSIESNAGTIRGGTGGSTDSSVSGAFTKGSARNGGKIGTQSGTGFDFVFDSSLSARSADETRMLNRGMTPAIFLGV